MLRVEPNPLEEQSNEQQENVAHPESAPLWVSNILFVSVVHLIGLCSLFLYTPKLGTLVMCFVIWQLTGLGITMGYHRLWSHRTFEAAFVLRLVLAILGTAAFQGSIKWWVLRHRLHHRFIDTDNDPHNATRGLWFSHIGWIFEKPTYTKIKDIDVSDLNSDPIVQFQHRYFVPLALLTSYGIPWFVAWTCWDDPVGGFLYGGFVLRIVIWHCVFSINSLAHFIGSQEYSLENTSRGNEFLAFLTNGEGHHNYHHAFPLDYRNGINIWDYDPTKWAIQLAAICGLVWNLKSTSDDEISLAKLEVMKEKLESMMVNDEENRDWHQMTIKDFNKKIKAGRKLFIIDNYVVDFEPYMSEHPGGAEIMNSYVGMDATEAFHGGINAHSLQAKMEDPSYLNEKMRFLRRISSTAFKESLNALVKENKLMAENLENLPVDEVNKTLTNLLRNQNLISGMDRKPPIKVPYLHEMNNKQWIESNGPALTRHLAKVYGVIPGLLPIETEISVNLAARFGEQWKIQRGNLLTPDKTRAKPLVKFHTRLAEKFYSLFLVDGDHPDEEIQKLTSFILWSLCNIQGEPDACIEIGSDYIKANEFHSYLSPFPARGTSVHRCMLILVEHGQSVEKLDGLRRRAEFKEVLQELNGTVVGYSFFRTCWTKSVSSLYYPDSSLGSVEPFYGEYMAPVPKSAYKFANA